ncbi:hypothetical protein [Rickettsia endosymbiont of Ceutorhynchus obstrictus]
MSLPCLPFHHRGIYLPLLAKHCYVDTKIVIAKRHCCVDRNPPSLRGGT